MTHLTTRRATWGILVAILVVAVLGAACGAAATATPAAPAGGGTGATTGVSFAKDIQPILQKNCTRCHAGGSAPSGQKLDSYANLMKGGSNGATVVAGQPEQSPFYTLVKSGVMPQGGPKLSDSDIQKIFDWVKAGANNN
jgi:cytochrome c